MSRIALCATLASLMAAAEAGAVERVQDGGFEGAACTASVCQSGVWSATSERGGPNGQPTLTGPICDAANSGCAGGSGGYVSAPHWARLGAASGMAGDPFGNYVISRVEQSVLIPAAPATLRFALRQPPSGSGPSAFTVSVSGTEVYEFHSAGSAVYSPVSIDVSGFAGGPRMVRFEGSSNGFAASSQSWEVDDVSLDAPDPPAVAPVTTGKRAAALAKCKKKRGKARKKCKKKANLLPV